MSSFQHSLKYTPAHHCSVGCVPKPPHPIYGRCVSPVFFPRVTGAHKTIPTSPHTQCTYASRHVCCHPPIAAWAGISLQRAQTQQTAAVGVACSMMRAVRVGFPSCLRRSQHEPTACSMAEPATGMNTCKRVCCIVHHHGMIPWLNHAMDLYCHHQGAQKRHIQNTHRRVLPSSDKPCMRNSTIHVASQLHWLASDHRQCQHGSLQQEQPAHFSRNVHQAHNIRATGSHPL